jgi:hypothetical protein
MNMFEFIALVAIAVGLVYGFARGLEQGAWEAIVGALKSAGFAYLWFVAGMLVLLVLLWLMLLYRPHYPRCRQGRCSQRDYQVIAVGAAEEPQSLLEGRARSGPLVRCRCGTRYLHALYEKRFYEVTADGDLLPYLRYRDWRRWEPDPG